MNAAPVNLQEIHADNFDNKALAVFNFQANTNKVYKKFLHYLDINPLDIKSIKDIPFLPVELFKTHKIISGNEDTNTYFESSGTTSEEKSKHYIVDSNLYDQSLLQCFNLFFGDINSYCILALLPSYLERNNASLVYMCNKLISLNKHKNSGFYLNEFEALKNCIIANEQNNITTLLIGVSFALLDFAEYFSQPLQNTILMETGGMKGRRKELTRYELHHVLKNNFKLDNIYSEYGMTELLSQAYSKGSGVFACPPWMKIFIRDAEDPFTMLQTGHSGCINIIDLANSYSCSFIATQDIGKLNTDGSFTVSGRYDMSDVRGCNLMVD